LANSDSELATETVNHFIRFCETSGNQKVRNHSEEQGVNGKIIRLDPMETVWIHTDKWRPLANTVMNLRSPWKARNFLT